MTDQTPKPKFTPQYKVVLYTVLLRAVEKEDLSNPTQLTKDAKLVAIQHVRNATDEVMR